MKAKSLKHLCKPVTGGDSGFTRVELLVVIAVITLLAIVHVAAQTRANRHTKVAQCAGNVQRITHALLRSAAGNNDTFPARNVSSSVWSLDRSIADALVLDNLEWKTFYCPGTAPRFTDTDNYSLWNFTSSYRVTGYAFTIPGAADLAASNVCSTVQPQSIQVGGTVYPAIPNSERVLVADATISAPGQNNPASRYFPSYNYIQITGAYSKPFLTAHLDGRYPVGGNLGMVDGHVQWRKFDHMTVRTTGSTTPTFWW